MSISGLVAIRKNGKFISNFVKWDMYPSGVGQDFIDDVREMVLHRDKYMQKIDSLVLLNENDKWTDEVRDDLNFRMIFTTDSFPDDSPRCSYYTLFREFQGKLRQSIEIGYLVTDSGNSEEDTTFCQWSYVWDVTERKVYVYTGYRYNAEVDNPVRFGNLKHVATYDDDKLPNDLEASLQNKE